MKKSKIHPRSLALIAGALIPVALIGGYVGYSSSGGSSTPEIPEDPGTIMRAIDSIISADPDTAKNTQAVGGYDATLFVSHSGTITDTLILCQYDSARKQVLTGIERDANGRAQAKCSNIRPNAITPILATIRDLDSSCTGQVTRTPTRTNAASPVSITDATDIEEGDTIRTGSCPLTSLYFVDHSVLRLAAGTTLTLSTAGTTAGSGTTDVTLTTGELWARVLKPRIDGSYFEIGTADGAVGVRGTSVWVKKGYGTEAMAVDSGKDEVIAGSGAITVTGTGRHAIDRREVGLRQKIAFDPNIGIQPPSTAFDETSIYHSSPFIRSSSLADFRDYRALTSGVGNLRTISMTRSWLTANDIYSGALAAGATGIATPAVSDLDNFVKKEFAQSLPSSDPEKNALCSTTGTNASPLSRLELLRGSPTCESLARIYGKNNSTSYQVQGAETANGWIVPGANGELDISSITGDWTIKGSFKLKTPNTTQHIINIGTGANFLRFYYDASGYLRLSRSGGEAKVDQQISVTSNQDSIPFSLIKNGTDYKGCVTYNGRNTCSNMLSFTTPLQTLFVGKPYLGGGGKWQGAIENIQITR